MMAAGETLLARATLWHFAASAFWYPEPTFLASLRKRAFWRKLAAAVAVAEVPAAAMALDRLREAAKPVGGPGLPEEHTFLFARKVLVSPHGTSYGAGGGDPALERARLSAFYAAFGFAVSEARPALPDHISLELEFAAVLLAKEAYALAQGWAERAEVTREARGRFLAECVAPWLPQFAARLSEQARLAFYPAAAELALAPLALADGDA